MRVAEHNVRLVSVTDAAEKLIEQMGRLCWKSEDKITECSAPPFIEMLKGKNHASVLEHASASFIIGTDRGISHELVRHRLASYSQTSTRYCNYSRGKFGGEIVVVKPVDIPTDGLAFLGWATACHQAEISYLNLLNLGCTPQVARSVLPTCLYTEVGMTANFREWLHFINLRTSPAAHPDMRVVAGLIQAELRRVAPSVFESTEALS